MKQAGATRRQSTSRSIAATERRDRFAEGEHGLATMQRDGLLSGKGRIADRRFWAAKKAIVRRRFEITP
jgi:hypothetical protein